MKLVLVLLMCTFCSCLFTYDDITNDIVSESINNTGNKKLIVFINYGNATVENSFRVSILSRNEELHNDSNGNIFIANNNKNKLTVGVIDVEAKWKSGNTIEIIYQKDLQIFKTEKTFENITINYTPKE